MSGVNINTIVTTGDPEIIAKLKAYDRDNGGILVVPAGPAFPAAAEAGEIFWRTDESKLYRRNDANDTWLSVSVDASSLDHGSLQGLGDNDHPQYLLIADFSSQFDASLATKDTGDLAEGANLYYTEGRVSANADVSANTAHRNTSGNPHGTTAADVGAIPSSEKGASNGVATLDAVGKVPTAQIPASALPEVFVVADETARLALTVQSGDEAIQLDDGSQWIYDGSQWIQRPAPDAIPNDQFVGADTSGGVSIDSGWTDVEFDSVLRNQGFSINGQGTILTVDNGGPMVVSAMVTIDQSGGSNRSDAEIRLLLDTGAGFVEVPGTRGTIYSRNNAQGTASATLVSGNVYSAGDQLKVQARKLGGNGNLFTRANGSTLSVHSIRGVKGDQGPPGAGGSINLLYDGSAVAGGPHDSINFVGDLVSVSDDGGGQATVTVSQPAKIRVNVPGTTGVSTTSATYVLIPGATYTITQTDDYLIHFSGIFQPANGEFVQIALAINGVIVPGTERLVGFVNGFTFLTFVGSLALSYEASLTAGDVVEVYWLSSGGSAGSTSRMLTLRN